MCRFHDDEFGPEGYVVTTRWHAHRSSVCGSSFFRAGNDAKKLSAWTRAGLTGIRCVMPSTQELDLAGCPILDDDVTGLLADLQCLERLVLDGCQKL